MAICTIPVGQALRHFGRYALSLVFPERCACCGQAILPFTGCCPSCRAALCEADPEDGADCSGVLDGCAAPYVYEASAQQGILRLKDMGQPYVIDFFAEAMAQTVRRVYTVAQFDALIPVPMTERVRKERGFDQTQRLAQQLAKQLDGAIPVQPLLVKCQETAPQKELNAVLRSGNVLGAYDAVQPERIAGGRFLLVDDVCTTGATLRECAKMLKLYGAVEVSAVTATVTRL